MFEVTYNGLTEEQKRQSLAEHMAKVEPAEERGTRFPKYKITKKDSEKMREEKRERLRAWHEERKAEKVAEIEDADARMVLWGVEFKKGIAVQLPDNHDLVTPVRDRKTGKLICASKVECMAADGVFTIRKIDGEPVLQPASVAEPSVEAEQPEEPEEPSEDAEPMPQDAPHPRRGPGRPRRS